MRIATSRRRRIRPRASGARRALRGFALCGLVAVGLPGAVGHAAGADQTALLDPQHASVPLAEIRGVPVPPPEAPPALADSPRARALGEQARQRLENGQLPEALDSLDAALQATPNDSYELNYLLALTKARLGRAGEARSAAALAARLRPAAADVHYLLGTLYQQQGQLAAAIRHFRTATLAAERELNNPRVTASWYQLAECLRKRGYLLAAAQAYEQFDLALWDTHPEHRDAEEVRPLLEAHPRGAIEQRLELYERLGRPQEAVRAAAWAAQSRPGDSYLARAYVRVLLDAARADEAFDYCRRRLQDASAARGLLGVAVAAARAAERLEEWVNALAADVAADRGIARAALVAQRLGAVGVPGEAVRLWQALRKQRPADAGLAWALATAQRAAGRLPAAFETLVEFVRENPDVRDVPQRRLADWLAACQKRAAALEFIAERSGGAGRDFAANFVLGSIAAACGQQTLAEKLFTACLQERPGFTWARLVWGQMLLVLYQWEPAKEQAAAALAATPNLAGAYFIMAEAHAGLDENQDATQAFKTAMRLAPDEPAYAVAFARQQRRLGNWLGAQRYFERALSSDPANEAATEGLIESYLADGKFELARARLAQAGQAGVSDDVLRRCRTAIRFLRAPFQQEHLAELARQYERHPDDTRTGLLLAGGLARAPGRVDEAYAVTEKIRALAPDDDQLLLLRARLHKRRLEFDQAIKALTTLAQRYPNRRDVLTLLAATYLHDFQLSAARTTLRRILGLSLEDELRAAYRAQLLRTHTLFGEFDEALRLLKDWRREDPENDGVRQAELTVLSQAGRRSEAVEAALAYLDRVWARWLPALLRPAAPDGTGRESYERVKSAYEVCAFVCREGGQLRQVERRLRDWLVKYPDEPTLTDWLVQVLLEDGQATAALEAVAAFRPKTWAQAIAARVWRGNCMAAAGRTDDALAEFDALLNDRLVRANAGDVAEVREQIVLTLVRAGRYDEALRRCAAWELGLDEGADETRQRLLALKQMVLLAAGRTDEYTRVAEALLEYAPDDAGLNNDLGYTWVDMGRNLERATRMIRKAVAADPLNQAYLDSLGWAEYKAGNWAGARRLLARAVRLQQGQDALIYDHLADAEYRLGDHKAAAAHWKRALELLGEASSDASPSPERAELTAQVRAKLAALENGETPAVAPTAQEQNRE